MKFDHPLSKIIFSEMTKQVFPKTKEKLAEVFVNLLLNKDGPKVLSSIRLTKKQKFILDISNAWTSIILSHERLDTTLKFLQRFPSGRNEFKKHDYLQYHCEAFVQNSYIVYERSKHFYSKHYANTSLFDKKFANGLESEIKRVGKEIPLLSIREKHVHWHKPFQQHFLYRDSFLSRLIDIKGSSLKGVVYSKESEIYEIRDKILDLYSGYQEGMTNYLNAYSDALKKQIVKKNRLIIPPEFK